MDNNYLKKKIQIVVKNFKMKNFNFVISKSLDYLKKFPQTVILYNLLGSSYQSIGEYTKARDVFIEGLKLDSKNIAIKNNLATSYKYLLQYEDAENLYKKIIEINPNYINAYVNLGNLKRDVNKLNEAIELYELANKISPNNHIILYLLALAHQGLGNFERSIEYAKKVLLIDPTFAKADHLISQSKTYKKDDWHYISLLDKIENTQLEETEKTELYFSLSKAYEDQDNINLAYKFLKIGNDLNNKKIKYDVNTDLKLIQNTKNLFNNINFKKFANKNSHKIIFILGMPRSGTSLLEQIISSHSNVVGGGELPIMSNLVKKHFMDRDQISINYFTKIIEDPSKILTLANDYLNFIKYFDIGDGYIIDKSPLNFRWIGFIKILFPNAKIIHCHRDQKNNCLSMYKNLFEASLGFTYNEKDLVKFYKSYQDLLNFWQSKDGVDLINVSYEELIENNESEIKRIINSCKVDWEENCLHYYKNKNPIKTMSTAQARKPIYKSSVNAFEKFKFFLEDINKEF